MSEALNSDVRSTAPVASVPWYRLWAMVGVVFLVAMAITQGRWIASPYFAPSPVGSDPLTAKQAFGLHAMQIVSSLWFILAMWFFVAKPLRRKGFLSIDGKIALGMGTCWWLDAMYNYTQITWYYNAHAFNMGSWGVFLPGSIAPGQEHFPEPLLNAGFLWFATFVTFAWVGSKLYTQLRARLGPSRPFLPAVIVYLSFLVIDIVFQNTYIRTDNFGYTATWGKFTMFAGTPYQYPLYEAVVWSACLISLMLLRSHLNSKGESAVERGLIERGYSKTRANVMGLLAVTGFCQTIVLFVWMLPYQMFALQVDTFAPLPSYHRAGMCGVGTPEACADGSFGIPTVNMEDQFRIAPTDPRLSPRARAAQGE
jgi:hypothetical protein